MGVMGNTMERDNLVIKYYMLGSILVIGLAGGMLPLLIKNFVEKLPHIAKEKERRLLEGLNMFTSGLMLYC